jgi:predicted amidohydrolase YtcJ
MGLWMLAVLVGCGGETITETDVLTPDLPGPATVFSGEVWHPDGPRPGVVVIEGERILAVHGPEMADRFENTIPVGRITAGFVDAHAHPTGLGRTLEQLDLTGIDTLKETLAVIAKASQTGEGWILGRGWDQNDWTDHEGWPTAAQLDAVTNGRPARFSRVDGHASWVNTAAMQVAGFDPAKPPKMEAGEVVVEDGRAIGVLVDEAMSLVPAPESDPASLERWVEAGCTAARDAGLTGVHVMGASDANLAAYTAVAKRDALPIRLWVYVSPGTVAAKRLMDTGPWTITDRLSVVGVKAFADGALGSRGALLSDDYADRPGHRGIPIQGEAELTTLATALVATESQLAVHAIGDAGVHATLNAFEAARTAHPKSTVRLRVEHAQVVQPADVPRFAKLNAIASMQPTHATSDMPWAEARLGSDRIRWAYAWRTLEEAGAQVAFGSDFPVESHEPARGMHAALTRTDPSGKPEGGWYPDQVFTPEEAVRAFTARAARAVHAEDRLGTLAADLPADLTLWTDDWRPLGTVVAGEVHLLETK